MKEVEVIKYGDLIKGAAESIKAVNIGLLEKVTAEAKSWCVPVSGLLRNSIMWKTQEQSGGHEEGDVLKATAKEGEGVVGSATEYAGYQEFGTRKMKAQPFLRPAVEIEVFGSSGAATMKKYSAKAMESELKKRKSRIL